MNYATQNADKISANHIPGINRVVRLSIIIEGKIITHFKHFRLQQSAKKHHSFELVLAHNSLDKVQNHELEDAKDFLGKRITVIFKYKDYENETPERTFAGVITKVAFSQEKMSLGNIVLKGFSPTILMDSAPHTQSFGGSQPVNTGIIANAIFQQAMRSNSFEFKVKPRNNSYISYSSQYQETHYNYIARLAEGYGEQFFYDGEILHFGELPLSEKPIQLTYGSNVSDINVELKAVHTKPEYFGYNSSGNEKLTSSDNTVRHLGDLARNAYELSNNGIFKTQSLQPAPINANIFMDINASQKSATGSVAVEVLTISGNTTVPFLYIGCVADLEMRKTDSNQTSYFTKLMITEVNHEVDAKGYYTGSFEAIAEGTGFMPKPDFVVPKAEPQIATVISNVDPLGQGRIQVRFDWQLNETTHWIRMMSPDAGGTEAVTQNRGYVAIPEIGDQVMVGFEYHNPDFPFAMGGMFHGGTALGGFADNHLKSIQTRSGIKVLMNDAERSVTIQDPSGNIYFMDGQGNINVTAPNKITMRANDIHLNATDIQMNSYNNLEMNVSNNVIVNAMSKFFVFTPYMKNVVSGFMGFFSGKALFSSRGVLNIEAAEAKLHGTEKTLVHSDKQAVINSKGTAEMYGEKGNQLSNQAKKIEATTADNLVNSIVEFRPLNSWTAEFGFDWLRIDDNIATTGRTYYDSLVNGYEAPNGKAPHRDGNTEYETKDEAFKALEKEYLQLPINRPSTPALTKYYIPWLNLFPEAISKASTATIKPPCEAELRVLVDVETEEPDQIRLVFDNKYFTIDGKDGTDANPVLITDKAIGAKRDTGQTVKIKCIKEFSTRQEIAVYGYPKNSLTKTVAEQLTLRKIVGKIVLEPNKNTPKVGKKPAVKNRKELNVVLISVWTDISNSGRIYKGIFDSGAMSGEKDNIVKSLHQALINGTLIENNSAGTPLKVDVSSNIAFQQRYNAAGAAIGSTYITTNNRIKDNAHVALKTLFNAQTGNMYVNDLLIFAFDEPGDGFVGVAEDIGKKSLVLVNTRNNKTLPHEALHSLGLWHTHQDAVIVRLDNTTPASSTVFTPNYPNDRNCIYVGSDNSLWMYNGTSYVTHVFHENVKRDKKFIYHHAHIEPTLATYNLMSYNGASRKYTWHWQWKLLKKNVK